MKIRDPDPSPTAQDDKMGKLQNNSAIPAVKKKSKTKPIHRPSAGNTKLEIRNPKHKLFENKLNRLGFQDMLKKPEFCPLKPAIGHFEQ